MSKRSDGADEAADKTTGEIISVLQDVEDRPYTARELGHLDILIGRVLDTASAHTKTLRIVLWALKQNYHLDHSNAAVHTAPVRYSPLTFRLAESIADNGFLDLEEPDPEGVHILSEVLGDKGRYEEDPGR